MSTELAWPTNVRPSSCLFTVKTRSIYSSSPLRRSRRVFGSIVDLWIAQLTFDQLPPDLWIPLDAMLSRLDGPSGIIRMWDATRYLPRGMAAGLNMHSAVSIGAPFSDGTYFSDGTGWLDVSAYGVVEGRQDAGSDTVLISGLIANQAVSLDGGDMFEVGGYLYKVVTPVGSDSAGRAMAMIRPRLRTPIMPGDVVKFAYPTSPFQLKDDDQGGVEVTAPIFGSIGLSLVEVVP